MALLGPTRLLISEKSATYTIKWSYMIIWQVRVYLLMHRLSLDALVKLFAGPTRVIYTSNFHHQFLT